MHFTAETTADGVCERTFNLGDIQGIPGDIHGILWVPAGARTAGPLILLGHGGGQHKSSPGIVARAHRYVTACGFAAAAIDAPGHGSRPRTAQDEQFVASLRQRMAAGEPVAGQIAKDNADRSARAVPEWRATLDAVLGLGHAAGPVGYWGVSMGTTIGLPLVAAEPRIVAAVFGLAGHERLAGAAARVTIPVEFLLQWDDEMIPRESGLALFDALASREKTLHANPGVHMAVPRFEVESAERFFLRHLAPA